MRKTSSALFLCVALAVGPLRAQTAPAGEGSRRLAAESSIPSISLVKASDGLAVIRAGTGPLEKITIGDLVGTTKAVVTEISTGRIVLEEGVTGKDGGPNRALIIFKEGERGGTRYLQRADEPPFTGTRPVQVTPATPDVVKPLPKKPGPMG